MSKGAYVGVNDIARKIKNGYIGVNDIARKIKKAYIGIGGVARPFWSLETELVYYGVITSLSSARDDLAATNTDKYALFAGGEDYYASDRVDKYNKSLTRSSSTSLSAARWGLVAATANNTAFFAGGVGDNNVDKSNVDVYDSSLTHKTTKLSNSFRDLASTNLGNYVLFACGNILSAINSKIDIYDSSLTHTVLNASLARKQAAATCVGNYAIIAGGALTAVTSNSDRVDVIDTKFTMQIIDPLSIARSYIGASSVGKYSMFGGGQTGSTSQLSSAIDIYDELLVHTTPISLSSSRRNPITVSINGYVIFSGGHVSNVVDAYDASLTSIEIQNHDQVLQYHAATTIGNFALIGGGRNKSASSYTDVMYAYTVIEK